MLLAAAAMHRRVITLAFHYILKSLYHLPVRMKREREEKHADGYKTHHGGAFRIDRQGVRCHHNAAIIALFFFFLLQSFCPVAFFFLLTWTCCWPPAHTHTHVLYIRVFLCAQPHGVQHTEFLITRSQPIKVNMFSKAFVRLCCCFAWHLDTFTVDGEWKMEWKRTEKKKSRCGVIKLQSI